jgi:hypothetical protein
MMLKTLGSPLLQQRVLREVESNDYGTPKPIDVAGQPLSPLSPISNN